MMATERDLPEETITDVIVVGAGPVGLLIALGLGKAGINTIVLEAHHELLATTRAVVYSPVVIPALQKLGIYDAVAKAATLDHDGINWLDIDGQELARLRFPAKETGEYDGMVLLGQWRMNEIILEKLAKYPCVQIRFGARVVGLDNNEGASEVRLMTHTGSPSDNDGFYRAKYVIGTDGANSAIRRMSCIPFEGFTYRDFKMIGCDVIYDFTDQENLPLLNFVVDEKDWAVIAYTGGDEGNLPAGSGKPLWRVAYPEDYDLPADKEAYIERSKERIQKYMHKGNRDFRVIRAEPYLMQQRVAAVARKSRILLAGDALHSNNPIGGLGLTGGILDAFCVGNALARVLVGGESENVLSACAAERRQTWLDTTNKLSQVNIKRLHGTDDQTVKERETFFAKLNDHSGGEDFASVVRKGLDRMMLDDYSGDQG